jgi:hypothetical protein
VRQAVLIPLLALALASSASAAAQESPYRIQPTRSCLIRHGARHLTSANENLAEQKFGFGQRYAALTWNASGRLESITRVPSDWVGIEFAPNPARGLASERQVRHILHAFYGYGAAWIRQHLMRRANVVIAGYSFNRPLTAGQRALIVGCLRGRP